MKKLLRSRRITLVLLLILVAFIMKTYLFSKKEPEKNIEINQKVLNEDMQYTKKSLQDKSMQVKRVSENIAEEIEIVALKEKGKIQLFHDKTPQNNKYIEWIIDSNIILDVYYTATLTIDTESIEVSYDENVDTINIIYDLEKIKVSSINIDNILSRTSKGIFGSCYSEKEVTALTLLATDEIREEISNDNGLKYLANINLEGYLMNMVYNLGIFNVSIKQK